MAHTIQRNGKHPYPLEAILHGKPTRYAVPDGWKELRDCTAEDLRWHIYQRKQLHDTNHFEHEGCTNKISLLESLIENMAKEGLDTVGAEVAAAIDLIEGIHRRDDVADAMDLIGEVRRHD